MKKSQISLMYCMRVAGVVFILSMPESAVAQRLRLVIGEYDCTSNSDCSANEYCDIDTHTCQAIPVCETCEACEECAECPSPEECTESVICPADEYNLNGSCVKCVKNADCADNTPICDMATGTCRGCTDESDCAGNFTCDTDTGKCVECFSNEQCAEKCDTETNTCVLCRNLNSGDKPVFDTDSETCKTCREMSLETPVWNGTRCESCPDDYVWNDETESCQIMKCKTNSDCADGMYCNIIYVYFIPTQVCRSSENYYMNLSGVCQPIDGFTKAEITGLGTVNAKTGKGMIYRSIAKKNWWSAKNWCEAQGLKQLSITGTSLSSVSMQELSESWPNCQGYVNTSGTTGSYSCTTYCLDLRVGEVGTVTRAGTSTYAFCQDE